MFYLLSILQPCEEARVIISRTREVAILVMMESEFGRNRLKSDNMGNLSVPPGFTSLSSFMLKRLGKVEETDKSTAFVTASEHELNTMAQMNSISVYKRIIKDRPWIVFDQSNSNPEESVTEKLPMDLPLNDCRPKGVIYGCPDCSNCLKVTASWRPKDARRDVLDEAPIFHPTEEEFKDTLKYIASIRSKAEPYGICRIIPPPSWQPPCLLKEKNIWESSKFVTQIQRIDGLQVLSAQEITASSCENIKTKRRRGKRVDLDSQLGKRCTCTSNHHDVEDSVSKPGPSFSLKTFKKFADEFKVRYFNCKDNVMAPNINPSLCQEQWEPSVENLEGEYGRIVENPTEEIEVLCGNNLDAAGFSSGFPTVSNPRETSNYPEYVKSEWNLNNINTLSGSLLSFESSEAARSFTRIHVGMCFSSLSWRVEEHQLYSLCYMHLGEPKVWYAIPGRFAAGFEAVKKKYLPDLFTGRCDLPHTLVRQISPATLKSEGIPVYRCLQYPREFVLVFPGAYHSGFDCGFNCSEVVSFAPLEWLLHGQNVVELYCEQRRKTLISYDKLLLGAAREAVRAQWEIQLCRRTTPDNLTWKDACGSNGILAKAFDSRTRSESCKREFLCSSLRSQRMEKDFDATFKRECSVCLCDLHLSAVGCSCSTDKFACLNHAKQLCSCAWSNKFCLYRYDISELNNLCQALEGKLSSIHKWAREDLGLTLYSVASERLTQTPGKVSGSTSCSEESTRKESKSSDVETLGGIGNTSTPESRAAVKAAILNELKRKLNAVGSQVTATSSGINDTSPGNEAKRKACLLQSTMSDKSKAEQKTVGWQNATTCISRGIGSASGIKPDMKARVGQSTIPQKVEEHPKVATIFSGANSGFMSLLPENMSSESTSTSSSSESVDA